MHEAIRAQTGAHQILLKATDDNLYECFSIEKPAGRPDFSSSLTCVSVQFFFDFTFDFVTLWPLKWLVSDTARYVHLGVYVLSKRCFFLSIRFHRPSPVLWATLSNEFFKCYKTCQISDCSNKYSYYVCNCLPIDGVQHLQAAQTQNETIVYYL